MANLPKMEISEDKKERIIEKAGVLGQDCVAGTDIDGNPAAKCYLACAPATFAAICDAFRSEGIELMTTEMQEEMIKGMIALHAGVALTGVGTCGGVSASVFLLGYVVGVTTEEVSKTPHLDHAASYPGLVYVIDRFEEVYGAFDCLRLRYNRVQRAIDFWDPDARVWEMSFFGHQCNKCGCASKNKEDRLDMPAAQAAAWGAEGICDLLVKEPEERRYVPEELKGLWPTYEQIAAFSAKLTEMGFGVPDKKMSYRDYRKARERRLVRPGTIQPITVE